MRKLLAIASVFMLGACTDGLERNPETENVLPREKLIAVMTDLVKLESHIQLKYRNVGEYHKIMLSSGDSLFKQHGVNRIQMEESMNYYASRQDEMMTIYSEVLDQLNRESGALQTVE